MPDCVAPRGAIPAGELGTVLARPAAGVAVLSVDGEIDTLTAPSLQRAIAELFADPADTVLVIDLSAVGFLASSGLAVLIRAAQQAAERGVRLRLVARPRAVRRPLEVTRSDQLFALYDDPAAALAARIDPGLGGVAR